MNMLLFQDLVAFVHQQATIVEEQSKTIKEHSVINDQQSALIEVGFDIFLQNIAQHYVRHFFHLCQTFYLFFRR